MDDLNIRRKLMQHLKFHLRILILNYERFFVFGKSGTARRWNGWNSILVDLRIEKLFTLDFTLDRFYHISFISIFINSNFVRKFCQKNQSNIFY